LLHTHLSMSTTAGQQLGWLTITMSLEIPSTGRFTRCGLPLPVARYSSFRSFIHSAFVSKASTRNVNSLMRTPFSQYRHTSPSFQVVRASLCHSTHAHSAEADVVRASRQPTKVITMEARSVII